MNEFEENIKLIEEKINEKITSNKIVDDKVEDLTNKIIKNIREFYKNNDFDGCRSYLGSMKSDINTILNIYFKYNGAHPKKLFNISFLIFSMDEYKSFHRKNFLIYDLLFKRHPQCPSDIIENYI